MQREGYIDRDINRDGRSGGRAKRRRHTRSEMYRFDVSRTGARGPVRVFLSCAHGVGCRSSASLVVPARLGAGCAEGVDPSLAQRQAIGRGASAVGRSAGRAASGARSAMRGKRSSGALAAALRAPYLGGLRAGRAEACRAAHAWPREPAGSLILQRRAFALG